MNTPILDKIYDQVDFDRHLVFKFFTIFSLFEYGLKATGYLYPDTKNAKAHWERFAAAITNDFDPNRTPELLAAYEYMIQKPVMQQKVRNNYLSFEPRHRSSKVTDLEWLSLLIRGVRNNLFHGGKFVYDYQRDSKLITSALIILEEWVRLHPTLKDEIESVASMPAIR